MRDTPVEGWVVSDTPGRLRVRLDRTRRRPEPMQRLREEIGSQAGVERVEINPMTGSVVVWYRSEAWSRVDVLLMFRRSGVAVAEAPIRPDEPPLGVRSTTGAAIADATRRADRSLRSLTGGRADLTLLVPAALGALGLRNAMRGGLGLAEIPAFVLLWYAFDAFHKLHQAPDASAARSAAPPAAGPTNAPGAGVDDP